MSERPPRPLSAPPPAPPPSGGVSRDPSIAQWARAQALRGVTTVLGGSRVVVSAHDAHVMEGVIERWANYITTGKWEVSK